MLTSLQKLWRDRREWRDWKPTRPQQRRRTGLSAGGYGADLMVFDAARQRRPKKSE